MKLRFVLALFVALSVAGAAWVSLASHEVVQIGMTVLLAVLGFAALVNLNNVSKAFRLLPIYFAVSVIFSVYADVHSKGGIESAGLFLLSVVGFLTSIAVVMKAGKCAPSKKSKNSAKNGKNGSKAGRKSSAKAESKKTRKKPGRRKKKKSSKKTDS